MSKETRATHLTRSERMAVKNQWRMNAIMRSELARMEKNAHESAAKVIEATASVNMHRVAEQVDWWLTVAKVCRFLQSQYGQPRNASIREGNGATHTDTDESGGKAIRSGKSSEEA